MARCDRPIEPITHGNMRELGVRSLSTRNAKTDEITGPAEP
jgi:hypothetical protein